MRRPGGVCARYSRYPSTDEQLEYIEGVIRWHNRVAAYAFLLITDRYPTSLLAKSVILQLSSHNIHYRALLCSPLGASSTSLFKGFVRKPRSLGKRDRSRQTAQHRGTHWNYRTTGDIGRGLSCPPRVR
jgi:hypothetical protein